MPWGGPLVNKDTPWLTFASLGVLFPMLPKFSDTTLPDGSLYRSCSRSCATVPTIGSSPSAGSQGRMQSQMSTPAT